MSNGWDKYTTSTEHHVNGRQLNAYKITNTLAQLKTFLPIHK